MINLKSYMRQRFLVTSLSALSIIIFASIGYVSYEHTRMWDLTQKQVARSRALLINYEKLISAAKDAETGQRAYFITGDSIFLQPYFDANNKVEHYLKEVHTLTAAENPAAQVALNRIQRLLQRKQELLDYGIGKINSQDTSNRIIYTNLLQGKTVMDSLRSEIASLEAEESLMLQSLNQKLERSTRLVKLSQSVGSLFGLGFLAWALLVVRDHIEKRRKVIAALNRHNDELEAKVKDRTNQLQLSLRELEASNEELVATNEELNKSSSAQNKLIRELTRTQEQLRLALRISKMGLWEWDLQTDTFEVSGGLEVLHELAPGDIKKMYGGKLSVLIDNLVHPEDKQMLRSAFLNALKLDNDFNQEYRVKLPNNVLKWMHGQGRITRNEAGIINGMVGTITDITDRRQVEERIRESEERFRSMADSAPVHIWMADQHASYYYFNKTWLDFTGRELEEEIGNGWVDGIHPDDQPEYVQVFQTAFEAREPFRMEYRLRRYDNTYRYVLDEGVPRFTADGSFVGYIGSCIDIEDRKLAEQRNLKSERLLQEIFEESADALLLVNARSNLIVNYNGQAADLFGFSNKQVARETDLFDLTKDRMSERKQQSIIEKLKARRNWTEELEFKSRTGREFWGNAAATLISVEGGLFYLVRVTDITERRMAVEAIEKALAIIEKDNLRKTAELEEAKSLQLSMLPQSPPQLSHIDMAMYMKTSTEVGGDYYDYKLEDNGKLTIAIGDATGHGLKAGIVVATVKSYFQTLASKYRGVELLEQISLGIRNLQIRGMYMGLTIIEIDGHNVTIASSGMPPLLIFRQRTQQIETVSLKGLFLGSDMQLPCRCVSMSLEPNDVILSMSDGLPELFNKDRHQLDYERIIHRFKSAAHFTAAEIINDLNKLAEEWAKGKSNEDDITLVAIKLMNN